MNVNSVCDAVCNNGNIDRILPLFFGMYIHIYQLCLVGIESDKTKQYLTPGPSSAIFSLALCCLATEFNYWPLYLKKPPKFVITLYQVIFTSFFVDMGMRTIYVSSQIFYHWLFDYISSQAASLNVAALTNVSEFVKFQNVEEVFSLFMSLATFMLVMYVTEQLDAILNITNWNPSSLSSATKESIINNSTIQLELILREEMSKKSITKRSKK